MVSFEGLQCDLFFYLESAFLELLYLLSEHSSGFSSGVNAVGLNGKNEYSSKLQEMLSIYHNDSGLIRLSHVSENTVDQSGMRNLYNWGFLASSIMGRILGRFLAMLMRSLPYLSEYSTA